MPESTNYPDPKEATEAKLCAYLEGELPQSERAEIEQHLAANPQHRQLLSDLARTRDWMRSIPSESSPMDLAELFHGQAERSMLLDEPAGSSRMMIRMPQMLMVAAIMVLTVGLGVLVVVMLKGPKTTGNRNFSLAPTSTAPATAPTDLEQDRLAKAKDAGATAPAGAAATPAPIVVARAPGAAVESADTANRNGFGGGGGGGQAGGMLAERTIAHADETKALADGALRDRSVQNDLDADTIKSKMLGAGYHMPMGQKTVCFVISADSPPTTDEQVRGFFNRHQLAFDDAITGKHESPLGAYAAVAGVEALKVNGGVLDSVNKPTSQPLASSSANNSNVTVGNAQTTPNEVSQAQGENNFQNSGGQQQAQKQAQQQAQQQAGQQAGKGESQSLFSMKPAIPVVTPTTGPAGEQIYVAYGLSPLQFNLLSASLSTDNLNQSVKQLTLSEGIVAQSPTTAPAGAVTRGQSLTVTIPQLVGPGIDKTNVVKVADDGTISLPMIDPLSAAGAQPAELEKKIADKYREANLIPQATVTVLAATPSTQPIVAATQAATMPSTQPVVAENIPSAALKPVGDTVDVVVVIEKSASVLPPK